MTNSSLAGCLLKIERAREHRNALDIYVKETFSITANQPRLGIKSDPESGEQILYVNYMPELDGFIDRCGVLFGDAVHNLISALDRLSYQLALLSANGNIQKPNRVQFPICDTPTAFKKAKTRHLSEVDIKFINIMERFQGYHRIDEQHSIGPYFHPLSKLRDLASIDKHRLPIELGIPTTGMSDYHPITLAIYITGLIKGFVAGSPQFPPAKLGAEVTRSRISAPESKAQMDMAGYVRPTVSVDGDYPAVGLFDKVAAVIITIIREFEPFFLHN